MVIQSGVPHGARYGHLRPHGHSMPHQHGALPGYISSGMPPSHSTPQPSLMPSHQLWGSTPHSSHGGHHHGGHHHGVHGYGTYPHDSAKVETMRFEYSSDWETSGGGSGFSGMSSGSQHHGCGGEMHWSLKGVQ
ncbi:hypothetical protein NMG60_11030827 [Bertholletia excelsa]